MRHKMDELGFVTVEAVRPSFFGSWVLRKSPVDFGTQTPSRLACSRRSRAYRQRRVLVSQ